MLKRHLDRQHRDRQVYYAARARSRLGATTLGEIELTAILDSMGHQMYSWPRSPCMASKEFGSFHKPPLTATGLLIHGHLAMMALSPNLVTSGSSRTAEVLCAGLTKLANKLDFRSIWINLQADNSSKEVKNVGVLRVLALWTALHTVRGCEVNFLSSGHSHEDIDGLFNLVRAHIESCRELLTPLDFQKSIQTFFDKPTTRPYEPQKSVEMPNRYKDWILAEYQIVAFLI